MSAIKVRTAMSLVLGIYLIVLLAHAVRAVRNRADLRISQHGYSVYEMIAPVPSITLVLFMRGMGGWAFKIFHNSS